MSTKHGIDGIITNLVPFGLLATGHLCFSTSGGGCHLEYPHPGSAEKENGVHARPDDSVILFFKETGRPSSRREMNENVQK